MHDSKNKNKINGVSHVFNYFDPFLLCKIKILRYAYLRAVGTQCYRGWKYI